MMNPSDPVFSADDDFLTAEIAPKPPFWKRSAKFVGVRVVFWYVVACVVIMCMQRSLIYHPEFSAPITSVEAPLPKGCVHDFSFATEDGLTLKGWHLLPAGAVCHSPDDARNALDGCRWLVLFFHGNGGDRRGQVDYCRLFNEAGADVFAVDYRGYADNPGKPHEAGLAKDAQALWKYATETCKVAPDRIVIVGQSLGGGVAVRLAQEVCRAGTLPAGLVVQSSFSSLADAADHRFPWLPVRLLLWDRYPSSERIADVTCPTLILHGTEDRIVPYELGQKLFQAAPPLAANHIPKRFVTLKGAGHNRLLSSHKREITQSIQEFVVDLANCRLPQKTNRPMTKTENPMGDQLPNPR